ncbi:MAG: diguanylate cyclase [Campylobacterales bacterium]|nr:diguanylate cyclase [Campylobacterales bacterium]
MLSLKFKLFLAGFALSALPLLVYQYIAFQKANSSFTITYAKELQHKTSLNTLLINQAIAHRISDARIGAQIASEWLMRGDHDALLHYFDTLLEARADLGSVSLITPDGCVTYSTRKHPDSIKIVLDPFSEAIRAYAATPQDEPLVLQTLRDPMSPTLFIVQTLQGSNSLFAMEMNFLNIELLLANFEEDILGDKHVYLSDAHNRLLFSHDNNATSGSIVIENEHFETAQTIFEETRLLTDRYGDTVIATTDTISHFGANEALGWRISAFVPASLIEANIRKGFAPLLYSGLLIVLLSTLALLLFARSITRPLSSMLETAKRLKQGDYGARINTQASSAELQTLTDTLNEMAATIEERTRQLETQNEIIKANQTMLESQNRHLEKVSITDKLTGLNNRTRLDAVMQAQQHLCAQRQGQFSLILFDIDHFKRINDTHGHPCGDKVLQHMAKIITEHTRNSDVAGRWGGEEFMIILPATTLDQATSIAEKLRLMIEQHQIVEGETITASFGVSASHCDDPLFSIVERADKALYEAKNSGRNRTVSTF